MEIVDISAPENEEPAVREYSIRNAEKASWGEDLDLLIPPVSEPTPLPESNLNSSEVPSHGTEFATIKSKNSLHAGHHASLKMYETALRLLKKQIALVNPQPLKEAFLRVSMCGQMRIDIIPEMKGRCVQLVDKEGFPVVPLTLQLIRAIYDVF